MDGWMDGWMKGWLEGWKEGWMDGWKDGWKDGRTDGRTDGWMDGWEICRAYRADRSERLECPTCITFSVKPGEDFTNFVGSHDFDFSRFPYGSFPEYGDPNTDPEKL